MADTPTEAGKKRLWRQGDILIQQCAPPSLEGLERARKPVLAKGERTGHAHKVVPSFAVKLYAHRAPTGWLGRQTPSEMFLEVTRDGVRVVHPEHGPIPLAPGWYRIWRQREHTHIGSRAVMD